MKTLLALMMSLGPFMTAGFAQPTVAQISNAASQSLSVPAVDASVNGWNTLPNGYLAQGSYFTIYGNGFGGNASACGAGLKSCTWSPYPLPTQIQNTSVSVTVGQNPPVAAYLEFAAQLNGYSQINGVLPSNTPLGAGTLTVTYNGQTSAAAPINVVASSFGTFTQNEGGDGPGVITDANYAVVTPFHTFKPGQAVILWGTGLGPAPDPATEASAGPCPSGCDLRGANLSVTVWVGNQEVQQANLIYAGRAPGFTGEDELVFYIPANVTTGCYVSVAVQTGPPGGTQITSNFTTMAVDPNAAPCRDADGVNMNDIAAQVQANGSAKVAAIGLLSDFWNVNYEGSFDQWDNDTVDGQIGTFGNPGALDLFRGFTRVPSVNSCTAVPYLGWPPATDYGLAYVKYLDAGSALTIQGPLATQKVPRNPNGNGYDGVVGGAATYAASDGGLGIAPFYWNSTPNGDGTFNVTGIASGTYTVTGPGGADVGAFTGAIDISSTAAGFVWTNANTFDDQTGIPPIPRSTPLNITWTGGDPQGFVDIVLIGSTLQNTEPSSTNPEPALYVECVASASAGSFNVPTYVLQALPAPGPGFPLAGMLFVGPASAVTKVTPAPTGLDAAYLYYRVISGYSVQWQ